MNRPNLVAFAIVILLLNAAISLVLINKVHGSVLDTDHFFSKTDARAQKNDQVTSSRENAITQAVHDVEPAVVSVNVIKTEVVRGNMSPFGFPFGDFFGGTPMQRQVQSLGSGVIYTPEGLILTNAHVVVGATQIKVVLSDAREFDAKLIGVDDGSDIAVIKITGKDLPYAQLGTSKDLIIGEWAIALGNPYGFLMNDTKPSVAVGVVSAVKRNFGQRQENRTYKDMIQTDAAINPGNSGGPLVNINGEVIGINTFIVSESGGSIGIGFALPIDRVKKIAAELVANGKIRPVNFGFKVQEFGKDMASYLKIDKDSGVIVKEINNSSPAYKAGLRNGDVITKVNGESILSANDIQIAVADIQVGDDVNLTIFRDGKAQDISFTAKQSS